MRAVLLLSTLLCSSRALLVGHYATGRQPCRAAPLLMSQNPLAKFFGGGDKKKKGGALTNAMDELLKDAPLPVKLAANLAKPLVGALGEMIAEGQEDSDALLESAASALARDSRVTALLGPDPQIGGVFSSASSNMNGQKNIQLQFMLGNGATGALRGESPPGGGAPKLVSLQVSGGGQVIDVPVGLGSAGYSGGGGSPGSDGGGPRSGGGGGGGVIDIDATSS